MVKYVRMYLYGDALREAEGWMRVAAEQAKKAKCLRANCGTVIVNNGEVIGEGYNAPPLDDEEQRTCNDDLNVTKKPKCDKSCCMHAEWRAILDALRRNAAKVPGSRLYFTRVDDAGAIVLSGEPYCTVCSRFALDVGVAEFVLWQEAGMHVYPTDVYNKISYDYYREYAA